MSTNSAIKSLGKGMKIIKTLKVKGPKMDDFKTLSKMFSGAVTTANSATSGRLKVGVSGKPKKISVKKTIIKQKLKNFVKK